MERRHRLSRLTTTVIVIGTLAGVAFLVAPFLEDTAEAAAPAPPARATPKTKRGSRPEIRVMGRIVGNVRTAVARKDPIKQLIDRIVAHEYEFREEVVTNLAFWYFDDLDVPYLLTRFEEEELTRIRSGENWVIVEAPVIDPETELDAGTIRLRFVKREGVWKLAYVRVVD